MDDQIAPVDEFDNTKPGDLIVEKDQIRAKARARQRREQVRAQMAQERAQEAQAQAQPQQGGQAPAAQAQPQEDPRGWFRHISPIEAVGGAFEGLVTDPLQLAQDTGNAVGGFLEPLLLDLTGVDPQKYAERRAAVGNAGPPLTTLGEQIAKIEIGDPEAGSMIREIANFAAAMAGPAKLGKLEKLQKMGKAGQLTAAALRGFAADFLASDPEDGRAVDLAQGTRFDNPVFDMLQTQEGEGALERRLKQSVEGVGMGLLFDTVITPALRMAGRGVRAVTGATKAADAMDAVEGAIKMQREEMVRVMGDPDAPLVQVARETAADAMQPRVPGGEPGGIQFNFSRIQSSDDVKQVIQELADSFSDSINAMRRGVRAHDTTKEAAKEVDAFDLLVKTGQERGVTLNAEETFALRELHVASGRKVRELADKVASEVATPAEQIAFRRQLAVHQAIQERVLAVRTETARALNQWRIPAGDNLTFAAEFDQMLAQAQTTSKGAQRMAKAIQQATADGEIGAIEQLVYGSRWGKAADAAGALYYFNLLSGPHTHMRNMLSNTLMMGVTVAERKLANLIGRSFGDEQVVTGEAMAQLRGIIDGSQDAFRITALGRRELKRAAAARKAGRPDEVRQILEEAGDEIGTFYKAMTSGESGFGVGKIESNPVGAFSPEKLGIEGWSENPFGRHVVQLARLADAIVSMPGRALSAGDEIAKTVNARMELNALAHRQAVRDVAEGLSDDVATRYGQILGTPDESMQILAREAAERNTFTNQPLDAASWRAMRTISQIPVVGTLLMPFVRTPYNLATQAFRRTPLALFSRSWQEDLMAGGARTDTALAQFAGGTAAIATFADLTMTGRITGGGPPDPAEKAALMRTGWRPYSVRIGDAYFSYRGLEPLSTLIGMAADTVDIVGHMDYGDEDQDTQQLVEATFMAVMASMGNKTYLQGLSNFFEMQSDPIRYGSNWLERTAGAVIPAVVAHGNRAAFDNYAREVGDWQEAIKARTPGLSTDLPARRDVWGRPITYGSHLGGLYDFISPIYASQLNPEPIDEELQKLELWLTKPRRKTSIGGETGVNLGNFPKAYDDLVRLAGNDLTHDQYGVPIDPSTGLGLKDTLNALVTGNHPMSDVYRLMPPSGKQEMILDMQRRYTEAAKDAVLEMPEHADLKALVGRKREKREAEDFEALRAFGS